MIVGAPHPVTADAVVAAAALSARSPDAQPAIASERVMIASTPDPRATRHGRSMVVMDALRMHAAVRLVTATFARSDSRQTRAVAGGPQRSRHASRRRARQDRYGASAHI